MTEGSTVPAAAAAVLAGTDYRPLRALGRGATSVVVLARSHRTGELVAVKVLLGVDTIDRAFRAVIEQRLALDHPNVVRTLDWSNGPSGTYLVTELANAGDLGRWMDERRQLQAATVVCLAQQVLSGLAHLHDRSVIHRDLKPSNVLLDVEDDGVTARIADLGAASVLHSPIGTLIPSVPGTPGYIAPEVLDGEPAGPASDLFAVGMVLSPALERCDRPPGPLVELVRSLRHPDPAGRPGSAHEAVRGLGPPVPWPEVDRPRRRDVPEGATGAPPTSGAGADPDSGPAPRRWFRALLDDVDRRLDRALDALPRDASADPAPPADVPPPITPEQVAARLDEIRRTSPRD